MIAAARWVTSMCPFQHHSLYITVPCLGANARGAHNTCITFLSQAAINNGVAEKLRSEENHFLHVKAR